MAAGFPSSRITDKVSHDGDTASGSVVKPPPSKKPVLIEKKLAAPVTSEVTCSGVMKVGIAHPPPTTSQPQIVVGAGTVLINDLPASRWFPSGDQVACNAQLGSPPSGKRTVFIGGPTTTEMACKELQAMITARLAELERWNAEDKKRFKKWFGKADEKTRKLMIKRLKAMQKLLKTYDRKNFSGFKNEKTYNWYGQVLPSKNKNIQLANLFGKCKKDGPDSRASVVAHEMSHFKTVADTDDIEDTDGETVYGTKRSEALAKRDSKKAVKNADNFSYWVEGQ